MTIRMAGVRGGYTLTSFSHINYTMGRGSNVLGDTVGFTLYLHLSTVDYVGIEAAFPFPTTEALSMTIAQRGLFDPRGFYLSAAFSKQCALFVKDTTTPIIR